MMSILPVQIRQSVSVTGGPAHDEAELQRRADDGDLEAMRVIGGRLLQSDTPRAIEWYRKAAELGDARSMYNLGFVLVDADRDEALRWYRAAAHLGIPSAMSQVADLIQDEDPQGAERWLDRAVRACQEAPDLARADDFFWLGYTFEKRDPAKAIHLYELGVAAAEREGDDQTLREVLYNLAQLLLDSDHQRARSCLTRSAELGDTDAMVSLGQWTINTEPDESLRWFERAEALGDPNGETMAVWMRKQMTEDGESGRLSAFFDPFAALQQFLRRQRRT